MLLTSKLEVSKSVNATSDVATKQIIEKHVKCFQGVGKYTDMYALKIKSNANPPIPQPPNLVPLKRQGVLKEELDRLVEIVHQVVHHGTF